MLAFLAGCSSLSGYPSNYQNIDEALAADAPFLSAAVRTNAMAADNQARGGLSPQQYRDTVVYRRIEVIDINYYDFEAKLTGTNAALALGSDLTLLVLNGLGATTGSAAAKAALAAASGGIIGANAAIDTDIFYKKTLPALISQMRASRQTALVTIERGIGRPISAYTLDQALNDVNTYYVVGTLPGAVVQVTSKAGAEQNAADAQLTELRSIRYVAPSPGSSTQIILNWLYPPNGDQINPVVRANLQKLTDWAVNDTIDPTIKNTPWQQWVSDPSTKSENARLRAIIRLGIKEK